MWCIGGGGDTILIVTPWILRVNDFLFNEDDYTLKIRGTYSYFECIILSSFTIEKSLTLYNPLYFM